MFSFSTTKTEKNSWEKMGKTRYTMWIKSNLLAIVHENSHWIKIWKHIYYIKFELEQKTAYPYSTNCTIIWSAIISVSLHVTFCIVSIKNACMTWQIICLLKPFSWHKWHDLPIFFTHFNWTNPCSKDLLFHNYPLFLLNKTKNCC